MIEHYFFPEAGMISGIPGTFAGVQVQVDTETNEVIRVSPLARHAHFVPAPPEPEEQAKEESLPSEQPETLTNVAVPTDEAETSPESEGV